jgi:hypothetical protein
MSRGNQREIDRAKAQARTQAKLKQAAKVRCVGSNPLAKSSRSLISCLPACTLVPLSQVFCYCLLRTTFVRTISLSSIVSLHYLGR